MYTPRHVERSCRDALAQGKILVIIGARQTGKSTLAKELVSQTPDTERLYLNLDDPFLRDRLVGVEGALEAEMDAAAGGPWTEGERFHLVLDEAQKAPTLFEIVKALYDAHRGRLAIILTGSSALQIHDPVAETLAGRARIHSLGPFTLSEAFAHRQGEDPTSHGLAALVSSLVRGQFGVGEFQQLVERARGISAEKRRFVAERLCLPLFPEPSTAKEPEQWLRDYLVTYLEKDVQSLATVGNVALFRSCVRQVAARVGSTFKWETAAQEVGTTSVTLRKYVGLMEQTFNLLRLSPFAVNPVKRVIKAPKLYLVDSGLLWALRGFEDRRLLEASGMLGSFMENTAITELAKWCALEPTLPEMRFWSKTAVSEVDLVISNRGYHIPIEIKLSESHDPRWLRGLDAFEADHRSLGLEIPYRIILHMGEPANPDPRTYVLPLWLFG